MRQIIIARKDLDMSPGKLAAQVAHASIAFLSHQIRGQGDKVVFSGDYFVPLVIPADIYEQWFMGSFTKTVCEAKNLKQLLKAKLMAEELGLKEGKDFFLIMDNCLTELEPEIIDQDGVGRTLTCIGFRPLDDETAWKISKKYQLYK
jgi:PTH2 family peptidyl-tRNA hydrolase